MSRTVKLVISVAISFAAGALGSLATISNIDTWYATLAKPAFNPPNWLFGPVWTLLYLLMGISLYLVWTSGRQTDKQRAFVLFGIQLALNTLWSIVFFGLHQPWWAVPVIGGLIIAIIGTMLVFRKYSQASVLLLVPYLAWVSFATLLNVSVSLLN